MAKAAHHRTLTALGAKVAAPLVIGVLISTLGSCVAQETYDQAQLTAKHYQDQSIRLEAELARLEDENRRMRAQLDATEGQIAEAGYTEDIDARLQDLRSIMAELGEQPGDATKFQVDGGYVVRVKDSVLFDLGKAEVRPEGKRVLQEIAADIKSNPYKTVYVRGHTDSTPVSRPETKARFPHGNLQLSAARAIEVAAILTSESGVDSSKVVVMGFGPNDPVATNDSAENRQRNRRVDIFVDEGRGAPGK